MSGLCTAHYPTFPHGQMTYKPSSLRSLYCIGIIFVQYLSEHLAHFLMHLFTYKLDIWWCTWLSRSCNPPKLLKCDTFTEILWILQNPLTHLVRPWILRILWPTWSDLEFYRTLWPTCFVSTDWTISVHQIGLLLIKLGEACVGSVSNVHNDR